jgi:uncharacterized protein related to proFAR isomerase
VDVIPVIDVRFGAVVRAIAGNRADYRPIVSPLFEGSEPRAAVRGLMALYPFPVIYVADLDAIEGRPSNPGLFAAIAADHAGVELWVDQGARTLADVARQLWVDGVSAVVGSETGITAGELRALAARFGPRIVASLDFRVTGFVGRPEVLADPDCWLDRVIAMTLAHVGVAQGPDLATLSDIARRHPGGSVFAAGGIRHAADLAAARSAGACGALVSSALHAQTITAADLMEVCGR